MEFLSALNHIQGGLNPQDNEIAVALRSRRPLLWLNPQLSSTREVLDDLARGHSIDMSDIVAAECMLRRWSSALIQLFPELESSNGVIESPLIDLTDASSVTGVKTAGRTLIKGDHALPIAGSIKARGGIYEVLAHAEGLASTNGLLTGDCNPLQLLDPKIKAFFAKHTIAVGSTGNLGLSIGVMASALGFHSVVHMSHDAKEWKKARLRKRGVEVIEHEGDYAAAVASGRQDALLSANSYFVDDENSRNLFLGYAVAALRLQGQLSKKGVEVNEANPLFVYLPCGVGGAPGGITFGLKHVFGDAVHCFFAEPCASPAMLVRMASETGPQSVYDIGLDNITEADGLAVAEASELVYQLVHRLVSGVYTVADDDLFRVLAALKQLNGVEIEPSASAAFLGLKFLEAGSGRGYLQSVLSRCNPENATHIFWTTGGSFVPPEEYKQFFQRGSALLAEHSTFL